MTAENCRLISAPPPPNRWNSLLLGLRPHNSVGVVVVAVDVGQQSTAVVRQVAYHEMFGGSAPYGHSLPI